MQLNPLSRKNIGKTVLPGLAVAAALSLLALAFVPGLNTSGETTRVAVHRGDSFSTIVAGLQRAGTIRLRWPVSLTGRLIGRLHHIKPGRYTIPPAMSSYQLLAYMRGSSQDEVRITIPEGLDLHRTAAILARELDIDSASIVRAASDARLLRRHALTAENAEGYLFPGTYNFVWAATPEETVSFLIERCRAFCSDSLLQAAKAKGLTERELLTLASIVEAETPLDEEKPLVASVYLNRLKKGMRLQADPTVQYAIGESRRLYYRDLETDSPYNTYRVRGLPPGPICSPGAASIMAATNPARTNYLYFVATGRGGHYFASTLSGHAANVRRYRSARSSR
ncbi:endolytic transglycosylase MltG [Chlorobium sp. N1]|uniref:endolytic transglycosylase MltG n=1 Tax=Chlorobium sp. N1 TaxID=2491138 RepID=UPI00103E142F|nr:endolytic transglycosylase MltG [Chlorobium sp. N1]TCD48190.1 endolytic transglycosylase MltG [Chlorobium sp. N1]